MGIFTGLISGFQTALQPLNFLYCFVGVLIGTLIGVLPGIGPIGALSILLPATFGMPASSSIIMLAGIFYGAQYGGSTTSILVNIPGEATSIITCLDGYQMAKRGRAGPALGISAFGSFIGGTFSLLVLLFLVFPLADAALKFGAPEYFSVVFLSMTVLTYLTVGSVVNATIMILVGLILGTVGVDMISGMQRFTFGCASLLDGIELISLAMGFFGISEILIDMEGSEDQSIIERKIKIKHLLPNVQDWRRSIGPIIRGSLIGFILGIFPGSGVIPTFLSYSVEKKLSKNPQEFGQGAIEAVAGPETANNAMAGAHFVPLLSLGIPASGTMALLLGALIIHGVTPGPLLISQHPEVFWGVIASMYIGNVMLLLLNLPLIGIWVRVLRVPRGILMPLILLCCLIGAYSVHDNPMDVTIMIIFGVAGYILRKFDYELTPLLIAFVLAPLLETSLRQSLILSDGKLSIFAERPISFAILGISILLVISSGFSSYRKTRKRIQ